MWLQFNLIYVLKVLKNAFIPVPLPLSTVKEHLHLIGFLLHQLQ